LCSGRIGRCCCFSLGAERLPFFCCVLVVMGIDLVLISKISVCWVGSGDVRRGFVLGFNLWQLRSVADFGCLGCERDRSWGGRVVNW